MQDRKQNIAVSVTLLAVFASMLAAQSMGWSSFNSKADKCKSQISKNSEFYDVEFRDCIAEIASKS